MKRRGFLASILAAGFAPAAVGSGVLMPVRPQVITLRDWAAQHLADMEQAMLFGLMERNNEILTELQWVEVNPALTTYVWRPKPYVYRPGAINFAEHEVRPVQISARGQRVGPSGTER